MRQLIRAILSVRWLIDFGPPVLGVLGLGIACWLLGRFGALRVSRVGLASSLVFMSLMASAWFTIIILPPDQVPLVETWGVVLLHLMVFGIFLVLLLCGVMPWALRTTQAWWTRQRDQ